MQSTISTTGFYLPCTAGICTSDWAQPHSLMYSKCLLPSPVRAMTQSTAVCLQKQPMESALNTSAWAHHLSLSMVLNVLLKSQPAQRCTFSDLLPSLFKSVICAAGLMSRGWTPTCYLNQTKWNVLWVPPYTNNSSIQHKEDYTLASYLGEETSGLYSLFS